MPVIVISCPSWVDFVWVRRVAWTLSHTYQGTKLAGPSPPPPHPRTCEYLMFSCIWRQTLLQLQQGVASTPAVFLTQLQSREMYSVTQLTRRLQTPFILDVWSAEHRAA